MADCHVTTIKETTDETDVPSLVADARLRKDSKGGPER
jgi:hypothetical protein